MQAEVQDDLEDVQDMVETDAAGEDFLEDEEKNDDDRAVESENEEKTRRPRRSRSFTTAKGKRDWRSIAVEEIVKRDDFFGDSNQHQKWKELNAVLRRYGKSIEAKMLKRRMWLLFQPSYTPKWNADETDKRNLDKVKAMYSNFKADKDCWHSFLLQKFADNLHYFDFNQNDKRAMSNEWSQVFSQDYGIPKTHIQPLYFARRFETPFNGYKFYSASTPDDEINFKKIKAKILASRPSANKVVLRSQRRHLQAYGHADADEEEPSTSTDKKKDRSKRKQTRVLSDNKQVATPKRRFHRQRQRVQKSPCQEESNSKSSTGTPDPSTSRTYNRRVAGQVIDFQIVVDTPTPMIESHGDTAESWHPDEDSDTDLPGPSTSKYRYERKSRHVKDLEGENALLSLKEPSTPFSQPRKSSRIAKVAVSVPKRPHQEELEWDSEITEQSTSEDCMWNMDQQVMECVTDAAAQENGVESPKNNHILSSEVRKTPTITRAPRPQKVSRLEDRIADDDVSDPSAAKDCTECWITKAALEALRRENAELHRSLREKEKIIEQLEAEKHAPGANTTHSDDNSFTIVDESKIKNGSRKHLLSLKGSMLRNYHVHDFIGNGAYGVVFRASDEHTGNSFAMKCVMNRKAARTESKVMEKLGNIDVINRFLCLPNETFTEEINGIPFDCFVMEMLPTSLYDLCFGPEYVSKIFPSETILSVVGQAFSALAFLNKNGIVHCDVKPANIMMKRFSITENGGTEEITSPEIRLIDLNESWTSLVNDMYQPDPRYRAPELVMGVAHNESIDTFSLGVVAVEMLDRRHLFDFDCQEEGEEQTYEHICRIIDATQPLPTWMWNFSPRSQANLPVIPPIQHSVDEIFKQKMILGPFSTSLAKVISDSLLPDPTIRFDPEESSTYFHRMISKI